MDLKHKILNPVKAKSKELTIMGSKYWVRKLPTSVITGYLTVAENTSSFNKICLANAELIKQSIVNKAWQIVLKDINAQKLLERYDPESLNQAAEQIIAFNIPRSVEVEAARKN